MPSHRASNTEGRGHAVKLAPGHRLPREIVQASQRERLMVALVEVVDRAGFPATTVADLTSRAHVSRAAFYEHYQSLESCFLATYDTQAARVGAQMLSAYNTPSLSQRDRALAAMRALVEFVCGWPAAARICTIDVLSAGQRAISRRDLPYEAAALLLRDAGRQEPEAAACDTLAVGVIGGIRRMLHARLRERPARRLPGLAEDLLAWLCAHLVDSPGRSGPDALLMAPPARWIDSAGEASASEGALSEGAASGPSRQESRLARERPGKDLARQQRERILSAVVDICAQGGYQSMTHPEIAKLAKVSYGTFYKHFSNKAEALIAASDAVHADLIDAARSAYRRAPTWPEALRDALAAYAAAAAANESGACVQAVEIFNVGHDGVDCVDAYAEDLKRLLDPGFEMRPSLPRSIADAVSGAILEIVHRHATQGRLHALPSLAQQISKIALSPFVGVEHAAAVAGGHAAEARPLPSVVDDEPRH